MNSQKTINLKMSRESIGILMMMIQKRESELKVLQRALKYEESECQKGEKEIAADIVRLLGQRLSGHILFDNVEPSNLTGSLSKTMLNTEFIRFIDDEVQVRTEFPPESLMVAMEKFEKDTQNWIDWVFAPIQEMMKDVFNDCGRDVDNDDLTNLVNLVYIYLDEARREYL